MRQIEQIISIYCCTWHSMCIQNKRERYLPKSNCSVRCVFSENDTIDSRWWYRIDCDLLDVRPLNFMTIKKTIRKCRGFAIIRWLIHADRLSMISAKLDRSVQPAKIGTFQICVFILCCRHSKQMRTRTRLKWKRQDIRMQRLIERLELSGSRSGKLASAWNSGKGGIFSWPRLFISELLRKILSEPDYGNLLNLTTFTLTKRYGN